MFLLIIWLFFLTADGYSIYIKGLPLNATPAMLEDEFIRFGPIKSGGIQVRSNRVCFAFPILVILGFVILGCFSKQFSDMPTLQQQGFCFGFVEFEVASAVQSALEVFISFTRQKCFVESSFVGHD